MAMVPRLTPGATCLRPFRAAVSSQFQLEPPITTSWDTTERSLYNSLYSGRQLTEQKQLLKEGMQVNFERASGILLHPTSFPGPFGIGDLGQEAYRFVDFLKQTGQKL